MDRDGADKSELPTVRPALKRMILGQAGEIEPDCREAFDGADYWDVGLDRRGLNFTPELSHAEQACAEATLVPWAALARFLSPAGQAGRRSLTPPRR